MPEEAEPTEAIETIVRRVLDNVSTSFPATIIAPLSPRDGLVNVQPDHKYKTFGSNQEITPGPINDVVLVSPYRTQSTIIRAPKETLIGSRVLVIACEHSLTEWRSSGGKPVYPSENRSFDFNDAVAILGLYPETVTWPNPQLPNTFEISGLEGTKFQIGTQTADLVSLTYQILQLMAAGVDPTPGPTHGQFINLAQITALLSLLVTIVNP